MKVSITKLFTMQVIKWLCHIVYFDPSNQATRKKTTRTTTDALQD